MKRLLVAVPIVALAIGAGGGMAVGQGTGGTVGASATGTFTFSIRYAQEKRRSGINPAVPRNKKRPKVIDIEGGNIDVLVDGKKAGVAHGYDVTTFEGAKKYKGGAVFVTTIMADFGHDDLLFVACRSSDDDRDNPCAVTGGTGRFAGARGTAVEYGSKGVEDKKAKTFTVPVTVTFIP